MFERLIPWKSRSASNGNLSLHKSDDPLNLLRRDFDNLLSRFFGEDLTSHFEGMVPRPHVDFGEDEEGYTVTAELPGFEPEDFNVEVSGNTLTVKAERREEEKDKQGRSYRYGSYYESFPLPANVNAENICANYHSGLLEVRIPKDAKTPTKRIDVTAA